ncbi:hypothetical protein ACN38_g1876 [Penicillium nordicum]|uniref:Rhodopsin domain-containing protein n=1 Tax=Penicillium nordicum TaxID=229535 RepID=A0A0M8P8B6_9EURO|nr:hypothetical protein ACN38_g1876 [Penicillium nordicum]
MLPLEGRSQTIFIVTTVFLGISFIAVCLRCFVRLRIVKAFGWDDSFMICAMWWWLGQTIYVWTCGLAKISIASALLRLTVSNAHKLVLWAVIGVTCIIGLVFWFMLTLQCQPVEFFWQQVRILSNPHANVSGTCMNLDHIIAIAYVYSITATLCDLILGLLPIALVWNLQMNLRTKAALAGILGMGCIASAAVIIRIPFLHNYEDTDFLYATANISIWSNVEAGLGITAGSLVTLRPLFRWFRDPSSMGESRSKSKRTGGSMPLSSINGVRSTTSNPQYWRPDIDPDDQHMVVTTIQTSNGSEASRTSSQEDLNPRHTGTFFQGTIIYLNFNLFSFFLFPLTIVDWLPSKHATGALFNHSIERVSSYH